MVFVKAAIHTDMERTHRHTHAQTQAHKHTDTHRHHSLILICFHLILLFECRTQFINGFLSVWDSEHRCSNNQWIGTCTDGLVCVVWCDAAIHLDGEIGVAGTEGRDLCERNEWMKLKIRNKPNTWRVHVITSYHIKCYHINFFSYHIKYYYIVSFIKVSYFR